MNPECDYCRETCFSRDGISLSYDTNRIFCTPECGLAHKMYIQKILDPEELKELEKQCGRRVFPAPERKYLAGFQRRGSVQGLKREDWLPQCWKPLTEGEMRKVGPVVEKDLRMKKQ